ncbi:MAG TPA: TonB family protein [Pyrinomonadaceae bacterium]|nr:TonB family protein [Pyrinomonadaceae bacterium]
MRRNILHVALALFTFALGFLISGNYEGVPDVLIIAPLIFIAMKALTRLGISLHHVKVAALTLLIWTPIAIVTFNAMPLTHVTCEVPGLSAPDSARTAAAQAETINSVLAGDYSCRDNLRVVPSLYNPVWVGELDKKAISKPPPTYTPALASAGVRGVVAVSVLVDTDGRVVWAQSISGHTHLRQAAREAACRARFVPTFVDAPPTYASGILTYEFGH